MHINKILKQFSFLAGILLISQYTTYTYAEMNNNIIGYSPTIKNLGQHIPDTILALSLEPKEIAYTISGAKAFLLTIKNTGSEIYTIHLSDDYVHNIFLDAYDALHLPVQSTTNLMTRRNNTSVSYRSITLYPSEFFTITIMLDDFVTINKSGVYKINVRFYPTQYIDITQQHIKGKAQKYIQSSPILISVVDSVNYDTDMKSENYSDIYRRNTLITREYNPYDVIESALTALQNKQWDIFFDYVDVTELFVNSVSTRDSFNLLSVEDQKREVVQYMHRLKSGNETSDLYPPEIFSIEETRYTQYNANIVVTTKISQNYSLQLYSYKFILKKKYNGWKIIDYTVTYLGIEAYNSREKNMGNAVEYKLPGELR